MTSIRDMVLTLGIYLVAFAAITYVAMTTAAIAHLAPDGGCPACSAVKSYAAPITQGR